MNVFSKHRSGDDLHAVAATQARRAGARPVQTSPAAAGRELRLAQDARRRREGL